MTRRQQIIELIEKHHEALLELGQSWGDKYLYASADSWKEAVYKDCGNRVCRFHIKQINELKNQLRFAHEEESE